MIHESTSWNVTLRQLRAFVEVAKRGGFTSAARHLHLTQSSLSHLIRELETQLGVRLRDRSTRSVALTVAAPPVLAASLIPAAMARFAATHPAVEVRLTGVGTFLKSEPEVQFDRLYEDHLVAVLPPRAQGAP